MVQTNRSFSENPEVRVGLEQKLLAFPVPKILWLYVFDDQSRELYHNAIWNLVGDRTQDNGAGDPEIWSGEFLHLKHAFHTNEGSLIIMRQFMPEEPRPAESRDFWTREVDLETGIIRKLYVIQQQIRAEMFYSARYTHEKYVFSDQPGHPYVTGEDELSGSLPSLMVDLPTRGQSKPGSFNPSGTESRILVSDIEGLAMRAWQFGNYYSASEQARIADLFTESTVPNQAQPATMAT